MGWFDWIWGKPAEPVKTEEVKQEQQNLTETVIVSLYEDGKIIVDAGGKIIEGGVVLIKVTSKVAAALLASGIGFLKSYFYSGNPVTQELIVNMQNINPEDLSNAVANSLTNMENNIKKVTGNAEETIKFFNGNSKKLKDIDKLKRMQEVLERSKKQIYSQIKKAGKIETMVVGAQEKVEEKIDQATDDNGEMNQKDGLAIAKIGDKFANRADQASETLTKIGESVGQTIEETKNKLEERKEDAQAIQEQAQQMKNNVNTKIDSMEEEGSSAIQAGTEGDVEILSKEKLKKLPNDCKEASNELTITFDGLISKIQNMKNAYSVASKGGKSDYFNNGYEDYEIYKNKAGFFEGMVEKCGNVIQLVESCKTALSEVKPE